MFRRRGGRCCTERGPARRETRKEARKKARSVSELEGGVTIAPVPVTLGEDITIKYQGLLAQAGAEAIYLHMGYGPADKWQYVTDLSLEKTNGSWEITFEVKDESRLNFCFTDNAGHWDNNAGVNWSLEIHTGKRI